MTGESAFDRAYLSGVARSIPRPRRATPNGVAARPGFPGEASGDAVAFGGTVIRADRSMANGWVVVADGLIDGVVSKRPTDVPAIATGGVILPGLIDLHGHPEFNVFAPWEPPKVFINRQQWRGSSIYRALVRDPWDQLTSGGASKSVKKAMTRYAEVRAVVGGVTAIQGASQDYPNKAEALVRNVDLLIFGEQIARSTVDFDRLRPDEFDSLHKAINVTKTAKAHYVHLAEGQKSNQASINEFDRFAASSLFGAATVVIHGTALRAEHFEQIAAAGAKLVWSPQSNLRLYDETTDIKAALEARVPVALGADWMPSGSPSLLHELKIAERCLAEQGCSVTAKELVGMVTSGAAEIAGLSDRLGQLAPGRPADLVVVQKQRTDPYENVVAAYPSWVEMVMIGGDMIYGRADWIGQLTPIDQYELVSAWGRRMALDTRFGSPDTGPAEGPPRRLAEIRQRLIARYPEVGPIFF
jgi:cytosine/adenosine deaminase-related metal-dependent hydrolase